MICNIRRYNLRALVGTGVGFFVGGEVGCGEGFGVVVHKPNVFVSMFPKSPPSATISFPYSTL